MPTAPEHAPFEALPTPLIVVRGDRVVYANPTYLELVGSTAEAIYQAPTSALIQASVAPSDSPWVDDFRQRRVEGETPPPDSYWMRVIDRDGQSVTMLVKSAPGPRQGERTYLFRESSPEDTTRKLTYALAAASWGLVTLRDEDDVLQSAADALLAQGFNVVILRVDGDRFVHVALRQPPDATAEVEQLSGAPMRQLPLTRDQAKEFAQCIDTRQALFIQDTHALVDRFRSPEVASAIKRAMPRRAAVTPVVVDDEPYAVITAQHDALTPAAVSAIELFSHRVGSAIENVRHHRRAAERLMEVEHLQGKLIAQERLATLGEAAAVLAHEVRNPVAAILNALAVLRRGGAAEALTMAEEEAMRLDRLVRDLLHLARPLEPRVRPFDLRALAAQTLQTLRGRLEGAQVRLSLQDGAPVLAAGDAFLMELALENLVMNAVRASPQGGTVQVSVEPQRDRALLCVDDQGPGIPPEVARRIFEPFFTTSATGTGLGLAVTRKVIEAHRGRVSATQSPLGGARFEVELPSAEAHAEN